VKKLICLLMALLFTVFFACMAMAETEQTDDPLAPQSAVTVHDSQYESIEDEEVPESGPPEVEILDEKLPQTGGIPVEVFYIAGGICIISAVLLISRKNKPSEKNN